MGISRAAPQAETGRRASHGYKQTCSEQPSPQGCSLQLPTPHLLGGCGVSSQCILAVPRGCSSRVSSCLGASIKWLLQGQGQGQGRGSAAEVDHRPPSSQRGTEHPHTAFGHCSEFPAFPWILFQAEMEKLQQGSWSCAIKWWWLELGVPILAPRFALQSI